MADSNLMRMEAALGKQQHALAELVDIALQVLRESGESSVTVMHAQRRLQALADSLQPVARQPAAANQVTPIRKPYAL